MSGITGIRGICSSESAAIGSETFFLCLQRLCDFDTKIYECNQRP